MFNKYYAFGNNFELKMFSFFSLKQIAPGSVHETLDTELHFIRIRNYLIIFLQVLNKWRNEENHFVCRLAFPLKYCRCNAKLIGMNYINTAKMYILIEYGERVFHFR